MIEITQALQGAIQAGRFCKKGVGGFIKVVDLLTFGLSSILKEEET